MHKFTIFIYIFFPPLPARHIKGCFARRTLLRYSLSNVWMIHRSDPRWLRDDFDILCTTGYFRLWCSFLIYCIVLYPPSPPLTGFPFYSVPLDPFPLLCARGSHSLLCHRVSLCFKTHNPVRSWHGNVLLMPVKVIQPVRRYTIWATAVLLACLYLYLVQHVLD